jgi:hypothetical protein
MKSAFKTCVALFAGLALAGCGGGGGDDGHGAVSPPQSGTITLSATRTTLPLNLQNVLPFPGSPFIAEVGVTFRGADGTIEAPTGDATASITPPGVASISLPDDPDTDDVNEFQLRLVTTPVELNNGTGTLFVSAYDVAGTATLTVSAVDPQTGRTVTKELTFTVQSGVGNLPASIQISSNPANVYFPNSGGVSSSLVSALVLDGASQPVANPGDGNDGAANVLFEIVGDAGNARLVAGASSGRSVATQTVSGIATASFQAGDSTPQGPVQIRVTADRSDNNVDNGISDPLAATGSVVVSDGKLYSIQITSPNVNAILVNTVSDDAEGNTGDDDSIPPDPDASYSLTVSAKAQDRQGAPVIPGTPIRFGAIDEPVGAFDAGAVANRFLIAGGDGDPQEGGTRFTAPDGEFRTAGGGAGPGDALIVFGKTGHGAPDGNEDLESALTVRSVDSQTSMTLTTPFNRNNTTGATVNYGPVLPYLVGRALHGGITASALTDELGVAHAQLTYTSSTLGHRVAIWAQGDGTDRVTGGSRRVTDAAELLYPGVAPASLTAFPSPIPGNTTTSVTVCLTDALLAPIQGIPVGFQLQLSGGTGSVDGNGTSGTLDDVTGPSGCVVATVTTSGVPASSDEGGVAGTLVFAVGGATASVDIIVELGFLSASPAQVSMCPGQSVGISVVAHTSSGDPAAGIPISAACTGDGLSISPDSAVTGGNGSAGFALTAGEDADGASGSCTFSTSDNTRSVSVSVQVGGSGLSPPCPDGAGN